jgi:hypothetical protein
MTTTIGFTINWWLVIGVGLTMLFLLATFTAYVEIKEEGTSKHTPYQALGIGRLESISILLAAMCFIGIL